MTDPLEQESWFKIGAAGALLKQYAADEKLFMELLGQMLESALPSQTEITHKGGLFSKKSVHRISVALGGYRYSLEENGTAPPIATRTQVVRGIALKSEDLSVQDWIDALGSTLDERAKESSEARDALNRLIG